MVLNLANLDLRGFAPGTAREELLNEGFEAACSVECSICTDWDDTEGTHRNLLIKRGGAGQRIQIAVAEDGAAPSPFDILLVMELDGALPGGAAAVYVRRILELAHQHHLHPDTVTLYNETCGLAMQWFLFMQDRTLGNTLAAYEAGLALWRRYFANGALDSEFMACVRTDAGWRRAIESVQIRQVSDEVVFMATPIEGMRNWYRLLRGPALPVVVVYNPATGIVTVQVESKAQAITLFGTSGLRAFVPHLGDGWGATLDRLARYDTGEATDAVTEEVAFAAATTIARAVIAG